MNKDFDEYLNQLTSDIQPASQEGIARTWQRVQTKQSPRHPHRKKGIIKLAALIAACLIIIVGAAALLPGNNPVGIGQPFSSELVYAAADYQQIYQALNQSFADKNTTTDEIIFESSSDTDAAAPEAPAENTIRGDSTDSASDNSDYSQTNTQVAGIDEGDIVKTDGQNIYLLRDNELIISSADGADSTILSQTELLPPFDELTEQECYQYATEIYVYDNYLAVVTTQYQLRICGDYAATAETNSVADCLPASTEVTNVLIYDIGNPASPQLLNTVGQDGWYSSSRLVGDTLYLISQYSIYSDIDGEKPETFIPATYVNGQRELAQAGDICLLPEVESSTYTNISAIDLTTQGIADNISVLGSGDTIYMNYDNLYIARSYYETTESAPYSEDQYTVVAYEDKSVTDIMRFSLAEGGIALAAAGQIDGWLDNQFALDEDNGYLRTVTTINQNSYRIYTDEARGWQNYQWDEDSSSTSNALWILDEQLEIASSIENLAPEEQVYSVRFSGDIGYFVTFRQVDPLFSVDLSDPHNPQVLSELKIPGFSEYLHPYNEGRLLGLGQDADESTGITGKLKLTMFDTSDPANVTEKHTLLLDSYYSEALYNHKAILVAAEHNLIAFPGDGNEYMVYGYDDANGFYLRGSFNAGDEEWYGQARGLFVEDSIYICLLNSITVVDIDDLSHLATLNF